MDTELDTWARIEHYELMDQELESWVISSFYFDRKINIVYSRQYIICLLLLIVWLYFNYILEYTCNYARLVQWYDTSLPSK